MGNNNQQPATNSELTPQERMGINNINTELTSQGKDITKTIEKVSKLEKNIDEIKSELKEINSNVATLKSDFDVAKGSVLTMKWIIGLGFVGLIISNIADIFLN